MSENVGKGFSLVMELEDPARLFELMGRLNHESVKPRIQVALASLDYVHFARFLPLWERGLLLIVTEFDGAMKDYVMDFAAVLDDEFSLILSYMKEQPPLPVSRYPDKFWEYVDKNTGAKTTDPGKPELLAYPEPFCDYPGVTALEIAGASRAKAVPQPKPVDPGSVKLDDVQAHTIRAYKATLACHIGFVFADADQGRKMLAELGEQVSKASTSRDKNLCITLGLTHAGLQAIGLPQSTLEQFPVAFREGPRLRSARLGDVGLSDPKKWKVGGCDQHGDPMVVHGLVSVYTNEDTAGGKAADTLLAGLAIVANAMAGKATEGFRQDAQAIGNEGEIHFGYRDGVGQPRFAALKSTGPATTTPTAPTGDLLLGPDYRNSRGGYYIGELPPALALNGTYAALRIIEQDVKAFEQLLDDVKQTYQVDRELTAAKLVGRWRDGSPLALYPTEPKPRSAAAPAELLDAFDYTGKEHAAEAVELAKIGDAPAPAIDDDEGRRCPFGAHVRRLNPRGGMVLGVPWGRRVVRRGMPYGPKFDGKTDAPRGLVGLFLCGDLESQFEFIQHVWANQDLSAPGLRHTQDVFSSAHRFGTPFRFRPKESEAEISIMVPPLTQTIGSAYLFMPGIDGLKWLARAGWNAGAKVDVAHTPSRKTSKAATMDTLLLDATSPQFLNNPYEKYAEFRKAGIGRVAPPYDTHWVFSHRLVAEVNRRKDEFLKPGNTRTGVKSGPFAVVNHLKDGLFFMDPEPGRHTDVRRIMDSIFQPAIAKAQEYAEAAADELLDEALEKGQVEAISGFAGPLASRVFFQAMGVPQMAWRLVDSWVRTALAAHRETMPAEQRAAGASAGLAMRTYFRALQEAAAKASPGSIMAGMQAATGCPFSKVQMDPDEAMNTATHMALGGYLSTEFLIGTGVYNLLRHPDQWQLLRNHRSLMPQAIDEMLRYDAPFQLADRWVEKETELGGVTLPAQTVLAVVYGSANRDDDLCPNPEHFDIERTLREPKNEDTPNFGFGYGIHRCIGESLARQVTAVAINALLDRCPSARIGEVGPWTADPYFRSLTKLQLLLR